MKSREEEEEAVKHGVRKIQSKEDVISIGKCLERIPLDLILDILLRLPAKSSVRFRVVSKLWSFITTRPDFIRSFSLQSSTRSCLLVSVETRGSRLFISLPQHEHPDTSYSHVYRYQINRPENDFVFHKPISESVHGLICVADFCGKVVVWNPSMRQHVTLTDPVDMLKSYFLGYDSVEDKYKVLCIPSRGYPRPHDPLVFTLGHQESWRVIHDSPLQFHPRCGEGDIGTCINGHVYYQAHTSFEVDKKDLMSFDVRYEKFNIIRRPDDLTLGWFMFNYEGKLAWVCDVLYSSSSLRFWVLEDEEKQEWLPRNFLLPFQIHSRCEYDGYLVLDGITHDTGEFIFVDAMINEIYVIYYDPKRNRTRRVIYEGIGGKEFRENNNVESYRDIDIHLYPNHNENLTSLENIPGYVSPINSE